MRTTRSSLHAEGIYVRELSFKETEGSSNNNNSSRNLTAKVASERRASDDEETERELDE